MGEFTVELRPVVEEDLAMFRRFATEPGLIGPDWVGFTDAQAPARRFAVDGYLGPDGGRLMVDVTPEHAAAGFVGWRAGSFGGMAKYWEIGIVGFQLEGVVRACEFRAGQWRDGYLYSRLRDDPAP